MKKELHTAMKGSRIVKRIEHPNGVIEERCADGSIDFRGPFEGEGSLSILSGGAATINWPSKPKDERVAMLQVVSENFPKRPIQIDDLPNFKGEAQMLLEAFRRRDAQFFRDIGDLFRPRPSALANAKENEKNKLKLDQPVWQSILIPAAKTGGIPSFQSMLDLYRVLTKSPSETATQFKVKLNRRHFSWIHRCYPT